MLNLNRYKCNLCASQILTKSLASGQFNVVFLVFKMLLDPQLYSSGATKTVTIFCTCISKDLRRDLIETFPFEIKTGNKWSNHSEGKDSC